MGIKLFFQRLLGLRPHKDTEARRLKSEIRQNVEVCKEKAANGDSDASLRLGAFKDSVTEQSIRLLNRPGKKVVGFMAIVVLLAGLAGCSSLNKEFVDRMDVPAKILLGDLRKVYQGQPVDLTPEQRTRRLLLVDEWEKTIKEAKAATEK